MLHYKTHILGPNHDWVVFLHGLGGNSSIWYRQVSAFRKQFNLLFIDLRGHGGSADYKPEITDFTTEELSENIVDVMNALSIEKAHFAGISLGSVIIHAIYLHAPERIKSMMLGGALIRYTKIGNVILKTGDLVKRFVPYMWLYKTFARILMPRARHRESRNLFIEEAKSMNRKEFINWFVFATRVPLIYPRINPNLHDIPKIYIMGDQDYMFIDSVKEVVVNELYSSLHIIKECGHVCNVEKYREFNKVAIEFFKECELEAKKIIARTPMSDKCTVIA